jgi:hypothetical protein
VIWECWSDHSHLYKDMPHMMTRMHLQWLLNNTVSWAGLNMTSLTPMDLLDDNTKIFAVHLVVLLIIMVHVLGISLAVSGFLECLMPCALGFIERLRLRLTRIVRENSPMLILMVYLRYNTTIFEQYPFVNPLMWLSYVILFCMEDTLKIEMM